MKREREREGSTREKNYKGEKNGEFEWLGTCCKRIWDNSLWRKSDKKNWNFFFFFLREIEDVTMRKLIFFFQSHIDKDVDKGNFFDYIDYARWKY